MVTSFQAVAVVLGKAGGKFKKAVYYSTKFAQGANPYAAVVADFNLDGNPDIATVIDGGNYSALFYGKGNGTFGRAVAIKDVSGNGIEAGDFYHDGAPDLAIDVGGIGIGVLINTQ